MQVYQAQHPDATHVQVCQAQHPNAIVDIIENNIHIVLQVYQANHPDATVDIDNNMHIVCTGLPSAAP